MLAKILILIGILLIPMIPTFFAIIDVAQRPFPSFQKKMIWFAVVTLLPLLGAALYFLFGKKQTLNSLTAEKDDPGEKQE